ncbi:hypothetical protein [uncultured Nocardioides sp.]|jgi:hypothetical protein|uniref:hypothetical protein n=1 Tax=uncultured Nocardioides sp. TaxID=198441 RepID=UPI00261130D0|nr:hypothetical protein [uncultured Nocardioides sp.]HRD59382.1 hypothetical protein [Nocardioides sp.]
MAGTTRIKTDEGAFRVHGLNEVIARLKALENGSEVAVRVANKEVATTVADGSRSAASALGGVAAHVAPGIKASAGLKSGSVALGDDPAAPGAEFGGGRRPTTQQFKPWRGSGSGSGYFLFPTIRLKSERINETYRDALDRIIKEAGLD